MAQQAQEQQQQPENKAQARKRSLRIRWAIFIAAAIFFAASVVAWFLSSGNIIPNIWSYVLSGLFVLCGILLALWAWLFPLSVIDSEQPIDTLAPVAVQTAPGNDNHHNAAVEQQLPAPINTNPPQNAPRSNGQGAETIAPNRLNPIFLPNAPLTDPADFYGRESERMQLVRETRKGASISLVGPRRIGKTWMMSYLGMVAPTQLGSHYRIGYLGATRPLCKTADGFVRTALEELGCNMSLLKRSKIGLDTLEQYLQSMKAQQQRSVLCIDEFEGFHNRQEFDKDFFAGLRAMTQDGFVLVTASRKSLKDVLVDILGETSPFFNVFNLERYTESLSDKLLHF